MGNPVAFFDITSPDAARAQKFYADAFGWKIDADPQMGGYGMADPQASEGIPGGIGQAGEGTPPGIVMYVVVPNAEEHLAKVEKLGGKALVSPYEIPGVGRLAVFADPDGHSVGLWQR